MTRVFVGLRRNEEGYCGHNDPLNRRVNPASRERGVNLEIRTFSDTFEVLLKLSL
jgi:hypothetical protein